METKTKDVALVLSSGGPRGFAYIGAIEELESRGYNITSVAGCSIGSLVGGIYAAGGLAEFKEWLFHLNNMRLMSLLDVSLSKSYLVKGQKVMDAIKKVVPEVNIEDMRIPYTAVSTDLYTGEEVVFREGPLFDAIRASISIPSLFRPVKYGYHTLIDGGIINTTPLSLVERNGHDILVAFDVNQLDCDRVREYVKQVEQARNEDSSIFPEAFDSLSEIASKKGLSLIERVKMVGDEAHKALMEKKEIGNRTKELEETAANENMPVVADDNYYSILSRSFSLMLRTISSLQVQLYKPDVLVNMNFDTYQDIADYAKGEEIAEKGRALMAEALDKYEK